MTHPSLPIRVLLFGHYRELAGAPELDVELPSGARVADLLARLRSVPELEALPECVAVAVNRSYADVSRPLRPDDEVALIPPVAGG